MSVTVLFIAALALGFAPADELLSQEPQTIQEPQGNTVVPASAATSPVNAADVEDVEAEQGTSSLALTAGVSPRQHVYTLEDLDRLRARYGIDPDPREDVKAPDFRCLVPDPRCGFTVELVATTAYAYRIRQGDISVSDDNQRWHSGRIAYDFWLDLPAVVAIRGNTKFTRLTLGPKGGVIASDSDDLWGNVGLAGRYWFGRGAWSPALEFTTALTFRLREQDRQGSRGPGRSPLGIAADLGFSVGGWGALVVGAQYDGSLVRDDVPAAMWRSAAAQFFVGFRGNILWGLPAISAVGTHAAVRRRVTAP